MCAAEAVEDQCDAVFVADHGVSFRCMMMPEIARLPPGASNGVHGRSSENESVDEDVTCHDKHQVGEPLPK